MRAEASPAARRGAVVVVAVALFCLVALSGPLGTGLWPYVPVVAWCGPGLGLVVLGPGVPRGGGPR